MVFTKKYKQKDIKERKTFDPHFFNQKYEQCIRPKEKNKYFSIVEKLKRENKINEEFLLMLNRLTLEDLLSIKFEHSAKSCGGNIYGLPIYHTLPLILKKCLLQISLVLTKNTVEAALFLGLTNQLFWRYCDDMGISLKETEAETKNNFSHTIFHRSQKGLDRHKNLIYNGWVLSARLSHHRLPKPSRLGRY